MAGQTAVILTSKMTGEMQEEAVDRITLATVKNKTHYDMCRYLVTEFEKRYGGTWGCIVGKKYTRQLSFEAGNFIEVKIGDLVVNVFKYPACKS